MPKVRPSETIFISYAIGDSSRIQSVISELRTRGLVGETDKITKPETVFVPGASIRGALREAIEAASKVVLVWSDAAADSQRVNYEAGMAEALGKPILLVVSKGKAKRIPANLSDIQVVELQK
jgi:hypothetical protein